MAGDWTECSLADVIEVKHGYAFEGKYISDEPLGDVLLTPGNFAIGGGFKGDKFKYYAGPVPADFVLNEGDLLITMTDLSKQSDTLGFPAFVPPRSDRRRYLHNQRLGKVQVKDESVLDTKYLHYLLCSADYRHEVLASATGTTVKHTSPDRIRRFAFLRPPIAEQRAIAHILGTLDDKIELSRQMNETLDAMARALFKSWFIDFEPVWAMAEGRDSGLPKALSDLFPDRLADSEQGEIPEGWKVGLLGNAFDLTMGQSPPGDTYNAEGNGLPFYQGRTDFGFRFPRRRVYCSAPTRLARAGDTLISVRAPVGDINMASEDCAIGRGVAAARHNSGSRSFTFHFMRSLKEVFARFESEGTVFGSIGKKDFQAIPAVIPPGPVVSAFERICSAIDSRIQTGERELLTLVALRDALLPRLISGETRLGARDYGHSTRTQT